MDAKNEPILDISVVGQQETSENVSEVESLNQSVDEIFVKVDQLEQKLNEVEQFYSSSTKHPNTPKSGSSMKEKDREKFLASFNKRQQDAAHKEAAAAERMQELMHQFGKIFRYMTQQKWAGPFMQPVDVVGLKLHDYYKVIEKPMDFSTIISKMEAKDGTGYKNVREICADVRLIFKNAMKYNDEKDDVHVMAKSLLDKFETRWLQLLPKVDEERISDYFYDESWHFTFAFVETYLHLVWDIVRVPITPSSQDKQVCALMMGMLLRKRHTLMFIPIPRWSNGVLGFGHLTFQNGCRLWCGVP